MFAVSLRISSTRGSPGTNGFGRNLSLFEAKLGDTVFIGGKKNQNKTEACLVDQNTETLNDTI